MLTIEEAARRLDLTPRQLYRRVSAARRQLSPYIRKGRNGALVLDDAAVEILRLAEDLRKAAGVTVADAIREALKEYASNTNGNGRETGGKPADKPRENRRKTGEEPLETRAPTGLAAPLWAIAALLGILAVEGALIIAGLWR